MFCGKLNMPLPIIDPTTRAINRLREVNGQGLLDIYQEQRKRRLNYRCGRAWGRV